MPHISITLLEGRSTEQKRKAAKRVTEVVCEELSCPADAVSISFVDVAKDSFARGGVLMLDKNK